MKKYVIKAVLAFDVMAENEKDAFQRACDLEGSITASIIGISGIHCPCVGMEKVVEQQEYEPHGGDYESSTNFD